MKLIEACNKEASVRSVWHR